MQPADSVPRHPRTATRVAARVVLTIYGDHPRHDRAVAGAGRFGLGRLAPRRHPDLPSAHVLAHRVLGEHPALRSARGAADAHSAPPVLDPADRDRRDASDRVLAGPAARPAHAEHARHHREHGGSVHRDADRRGRREHARSPGARARSPRRGSRRTTPRSGRLSGSWRRPSPPLPAAPAAPAAPAPPAARAGESLALPDWAPPVPPPPSGL